MEERTLQELNEEYVKLVGEVQKIQGELQQVRESKEKADVNYERAAVEFTEAKEKYTALKAGLEGVRTSGFTEEIITRMEDDVRAAEQAMNDAEALLHLREQEQQTEISKVMEIQEDAKKQNDRMNLILVSFGADETINKALVNELEIDYAEKIAEKTAKQEEIDALKTKINDDSRIQKDVTDLDTLLKQFEEQKAQVTPDNTAKLNEIANQIKLKRNIIRRRLRTLGVKGGKIYNEDIDAMATSRDAQGRIVVGELDRQNIELDKAIGAIVAEKEGIINSMAIALEMSKNLESGTPEYQKLSAEIAQLTQEVEGAEAQKQSSTKRLAEIATESENLRVELEGLKTANPNAEAIAKLQQEKATIEAESIELVDNPEIARLQGEIDKLKAKRGTGALIQKETPEYIKAKNDLDAATAALEDEKLSPSIEQFTFSKKKAVKKGERIDNNPEYVRLSAEKTKAEKDLSEFDAGIRASNPELAQIYKELQEKYGQVKSANTKLNTAINKLNSTFTEATKDYVGTDVYPELADENSNAGKMFTQYRNAELAVRQAMIEFQKNPTPETIKAFNEARKAYGDATSDLQNAVGNLSGGWNYPTPEALHKCLLGILGKEYEDGEVLDEAYNSKNVANRIAILEKDSKIGLETERIEYLKENIENLDSYLKDILDGKSIDEKDFALFMQQHKSDVKDGFNDPEAVVKILTGANLPEKRGFLRRLLAFRMPKFQEEYNFPENKAPEAIKDWNEASREKDKAQQEKDKADSEYQAIENEYKTKLAGAMKPEAAAQRETLVNQLKKVKVDLGKTPQKINVTRLRELEAAQARAKAVLDKTQQYEVTGEPADLEQQIGRLTEEMNKQEKKVPNPAKVKDRTDRANKKQKEIDALSQGGADTERMTQINTRLEKLANEENDENSKLQKAEEVIAKKSPELTEKRKRISILEVARQKMAAIKKLIRVKDANKFTDRRSGPIADDLAKAAKGQER